VTVVVIIIFFLVLLLTLTSTLFPYTTLFRSTSSPPPDRASGRCSRSAPRATATRHTSASPRSPVTHSSSAPTCSSNRACSRPKRSEEHTSELQSQSNLVCRLLLEKKKTKSGEHDQVSLRLPDDISRHTESLDRSDVLVPSLPFHPPIHAGVPHAP